VGDLFCSAFSFKREKMLFFVKLRAAVSGWCFLFETAIEPSFFKWTDFAESSAENAVFEKRLYPHHINLQRFCVCFCKPKKENPTPAKVRKCKKIKRIPKALRARQRGTVVCEKNTFSLKHNSPRQS